MSETAPPGWGIAGQLPPRIQRRMIAAEHEDRQANRDAETEAARRHEEAYNRHLAAWMASTEARDEYSPMTLATIALPADDQERAERTQAAIQHVLDTQRAQYQREQEWAEQHPAPPAGPPEPLHAFVAEPVLLEPVARSGIGRAMTTRARRLTAVIDARKALKKAELDAETSKHDLGLVDGVTLRRER